MPGMDAALADELRALRARAYGPDADIADDPQAVTRLRELERLRVEGIIGSAPALDLHELHDPPERTGGSADHGIGLGSAPVIAGDPADATAPPMTDGETASNAGPIAAEPPKPRRWSLSRRQTAAWIATLAVSAAAASATTYALVSFAPVATSSGAPQIATLTPDPASEFPIGFFGTTKDTTVWEFHGLTFFLGMGGFNSAAGDRCLNAVDTAQLPTADDVASGSYSYGGGSYSACQAGVFPATIVVPLDGPPGDVTPVSLRARFPDAKALQFVLDGDQVGVFLDSGD